jgi:hypothetical protein
VAEPYLTVKALILHQMGFRSTVGPRSLKKSYNMREPPGSHFLLRVYLDMQKRKEEQGCRTQMYLSGYIRMLPPEGSTATNLWKIGGGYEAHLCLPLEQGYY